MTCFLASSFSSGVNCGSVEEFSLFKWPKDLVLQKKCFSEEMLHTHVAENVSSVDLFTRFQDESPTNLW